MFAKLSCGINCLLKDIAILCLAHFLSYELHVLIQKLQVHVVLVLASIYDFVSMFQ